MTAYWTTAAALFGLLIGSFLNVCIYRIPRELSIVHPRSFCPHCDHRIAWYDNIPLLSYLVLRGRCRHCKTAISPRYPVVELLSAVLSVVIYLRFPHPAAYTVYFVLLSAPLLAITFIDLEHYLIPDVLTYPGIFLGIMAHLYLGHDGWTANLLDSLVGILSGGGVLFLLSWCYEHLRKREGIGGGDIKLAAMLGAFFGWRAVIFILLMSSVLGTVMGLAYLLASRRRMSHPLPYGPFMALAAWLYLFYGGSILQGYLQLSGRIFS